jgi:multiple sugar transport system ATP-binding protein
MVDVRFDRVTKVHPNGVVALDGVDLTIADGEFFVVLGPSGSGKSTLLRIVAGFDDAFGGDVLVGGRSVRDQSTRHMRLGLVSQTNTVYPHMTVAENLELPLRLARWHRRDVARRVAEVAEQIGIDTMLHLRPSQLSGGMRQRVAIGRALARRPDLLLMDEPMSNLDAPVRVDLRAELAEIHRRDGTTTIYVTHDQVEAMSLADRAAVMRDGRIAQIGVPLELYDQPADLFVATFVGSPPMTVLRARVDAAGGAVSLTVGHDRVRLGDGRAWPDLVRRDGRDVAVGIRAEAAAPTAVSTDRSVRVEFTRCEFFGPKRLVAADIGAHAVRHGAGRPAVDPMPCATVLALADADVVLDPFRPQVLALDPGRLHVFDLDDGRRIDGRVPVG